MKTGIYWQNPEYALTPGRDFIRDPSIVLDLPLYKLDGASIMSKDAYGHLCTVTGALWRPNGRLFDGSDDWINCGNAARLNPGLMTIEAWINLESLIADYVAIVDRVTQPCYQLLLNASEQPCIFFNVGGWKTVTGSALNIDQWYHLVATHDGVNIRLYVDAVEQTPATAAAGTIASGVANTTIGAAGDAGDSRRFPGSIGEIRIYNRALTPLEIQHNYLATKWRYR